MTTEERFWSKVGRGAPDECWLWQAGCFVNGYGQFDREGSNQLAHRVAYDFTHGSIPTGLTVDHLCRVRLCVNPAHLEAVTIQENLRRRDVAARKRRRPVQLVPTKDGRLRIGESNGASKLDFAKGDEIRERYATGLISQRALAREYGVAQSQITEVVNGRRWVA